MNVKILKIAGNSIVEAKILDSKLIKVKLPSVTDGWRFNFNKHSNRTGFETYVLVCEETPNKIEGCLIFEMKSKIEPYMAFIEIAPHNKGTIKEYERVAACLIAFACRLSFKNGKGDYKGFLAFDVMEENEEDQLKLMGLYSTKYGAYRLGETTMVILPAGGEKLINDFLN